MCQGRSRAAALSRGDSRATSSVTTAAPKAAACAELTRRTVRAIGPQSADADRVGERADEDHERQEAVKHGRSR